MQLIKLAILDIVSMLLGHIAGIRLIIGFSAALKPFSDTSEVVWIKLIQSECTVTYCGLFAFTSS